MAATLQLHRQIAFHETDAAGVAHFSRILCWAEEAEHTLLRHVHLPVHDGHHGWPRVACEATYRKPLHAGDTVSITIAVAAVQERSVRYAFEIRHNDESAASGSLTSCLVAMQADTQWRSVTIPPAWRQLLETDSLS